jgi:hypothetical protein
MKFYGYNGYTYTIETSTTGDTEMWLYSSDGVTELDYDDDSGSESASQIVWNARYSGNYYIRVKEYGDNSTIDYTISVISSSSSPTPTPTPSPSPSPSLFPESPHPYQNNYDNTQTHSIAGASSLRVTFDSRTSTESCCDRIYVMDGNNNNISGSPFSGSSLAGQTKTVPGNTVKIRLTSDGSVTDWGYKVTNITAGTTSTPTPSPSPIVTLNNDATSNHIAQLTTSDGAKIDLWVQRDASGNITYVSDYRLTFTNGTEAYIQLDELSRPTYYKDPSGYSFRVHFYLEGNKVDVTYFAPNGTSGRGIIDYSAGLSSQQITNGIVRAQMGNQNQLSLDQTEPSGLDVVCPMVTTAQETACNPLVGLLITGIELAGCLASVGGDVVLAGPTGEAVLGCSVASAVGVVVGEFICNIWEGYNDSQCRSASVNPLGESEPPVSPPTTGEVTLRTGEVRITLTWDNATDVDLHVTDPFGEEIFTGLVFGGNPSSASGGQLDVDDTDGFGPENIFWPENGAPTGQYKVEVVYFNSYGLGSSNYAVTVQRPRSDGSQLIEQFSGTLYSNGERKTVTTFSVD